MASRDGEVRSRHELAQHCWGCVEDDGVLRSLDVHIRRLRGKLAAASDCGGCTRFGRASLALIAAATTWPAEGRPQNPLGWQIALTLRAVGGLSTVEIARAFLVPEATMTRRITRAKQTIQDSRTPFRLPDSTDFGERLSAVLHVLYLVFNEGYAATAGASLYRTDLSAEAIRLCRMLHRLLPDNAEVTGLLALMLLTDARRAARAGSSGELIPMAEQDRRLWNAAFIHEGVELITHALQQGQPGPYQIQAAIAAVHDEVPSAAETDWPQIVALYEVLLGGGATNPVVQLNYAVAVGMAQGPGAGLAVIDALSTDARVQSATYRCPAGNRGSWPLKRPQIPLTSTSWRSGSRAQPT